MKNLKKLIGILFAIVIFIGCEKEELLKNSVAEAETETKIDSVAYADSVYHFDNDTIICDDCDNIKDDSYLMKIDSTSITSITSIDTIIDTIIEIINTNQDLHLSVSTHNSGELYIHYKNIFIYQY
jgi:PBP1b-binding outer membrane lipoprotein LpoB